MELPSQDNISLTSTETPPPLYVPTSQHGIPKVPLPGFYLNIITKLCFYFPLDCVRSLAKERPLNNNKHLSGVIKNSINSLLVFGSDRGPVGAWSGLPHGGGSGRIQRASYPHYTWCHLSLLLHQLPIWPQPDTSPTQARVGGQDELQGSGCPCQGELTGSDTER